MLCITPPSLSIYHKYFSSVFICLWLDFTFLYEIQMILLGASSYLLRKNHAEIIDSTSGTIFFLRIRAKENNKINY